MSKVIVSGLPRGKTKRPSKWLDSQTVVSHIHEVGYTSLSDWRHGSPGSHQTCVNNGWVEEVCQLANLDTSHKCKYGSVSSIYEIVNNFKFTSVSQWRTGHGASYRAAKSRGLIDAICCKCGITNDRLINDYSNVDNIVSVLKERKYRFKIDWIDDDVATYSRCLQLGWMQEIEQRYSFEPYYRKFNFVEDIISEIKSKNFRSRNHWACEDSGSYGAALRLGVVFEVCKACSIPIDCRTSRGDKKHKLYFVLVLTNEAQSLGYGITSTFRRRMSTHRGNAERAGAKIVNVCTFEFDNVRDASNAEKALKTSLERVNTGIPGFIHEACDVSSTAQALEIVRLHQSH